MKALVGNDIVDISQNTLLKKYRDTRFVERILAPQEIDQLQKTTHPGLLLWFFWTAKEAAYKALKKYDPQTIFAHKEFVVFIAGFRNLLKTKTGYLTYKGLKLKLFFTHCPAWIHCNAIFKNCPKAVRLNYQIRKIDKIPLSMFGFSKAESASIYSPLSKAVRILGKILLHKKGISNIQIIRTMQEKRFSPPQIYQSSQPLKNWDISMSHDGKYVACTIAKILR